MGTFQLVIKQMRQRALGTWLTLLSVLLGVALAIAILLLRDAGAALFGQTEYGYDVILGVAQGSPTQLVMNTVYHIDRSPGNMPYWVYEQVSNQNRPPRGSKEFDFRKHVKMAVPIAVGDTYQGRPIVGTLPKMFVSLAPLKDQIDNLMQQISELRSQTQQVKPGQETAELAQRQGAIAGGAESARQQVIQTSREGIPIVEPLPIDGSAPKWKYGNPASLTLDNAIGELKGAELAIRAGKPSEAVAHQDKAYDLLKRVYAAVGAASGPLEYLPDHTFAIKEGRPFAGWKFEAVIGSEVAQKTGLKIGSQFKATHGMPAAGATPDIHPEDWTVVGILKPTHTAADRCLYIPLMTFYAIAEHDVGLKAQAQARAGQSTAVQSDEKPKYSLVYGDQLSPDLPHTQDFVSLDVPPAEWEVSAILIQSRSDVLGQDLIYFVGNQGIPGVQAVNPARIMREFFETFLGPSALLLLLISLLVSIVASVGILVSIYNSVAARTREIAILRALGATRGRVLTLICAEAGLIGLCGAIVGLLVGHGIGGIASAYLNNSIGQGFNWITARSGEWVYVGVVVVIALLAGLVPAMKAYRTPVATNLVAA
jgi:putative ABC transport system permease protein